MSRVPARAPHRQKLDGRETPLRGPKIGVWPIDGPIFKYSSGNTEENDGL